MDKAVFLDRDGTLIRDVGYLTKPEQVHVLRNAVEGAAALRALGYRLVVATNQSVIGRGMMTRDELAAVHDDIAERFARGGADIDAFYYSPYHPDADILEYRRDHPTRKPHPGMLLQAAKERAIDLSESFMIGDGERDCLAGKAAGCRTVQIVEHEDAILFDSADFGAVDLLHAAEQIRALAEVS